MILSEKDLGEISYIHIGYKWIPKISPISPTNTIAIHVT